MKSLDLHDFQRLRDWTFTIVLDVTAPDEFAKAHVPGAVNIPFDDPDFEMRVRHAVPDPDTDVILYCHGRQCDESRRAAYRLEGMGYRRVHAFEDGMECWREAGHICASEPQHVPA